MGTYRGLLDDISGVDGTYKQQLKAIAEGGGGAVIITDNGTQLDKTYAEIYDLVNSGTPCYIKYNLGGSQNDLDTDYMYNTVLMPVVAVIKYSSNYRIYTSCSYSSTIGDLEYLGMPSIWAYQVSESTEYPTFYHISYVETTSIGTREDRTV